jgi:hypothetical protein
MSKRSAERAIRARRKKRLREEAHRLRIANDLIRMIASTGRRFFRYKRRVGHLEVDAHGRVWFIDHYTNKRVYTHQHAGWKHFTGGGTLREVVWRLRDYVKRGTLLPNRIFGPWPTYTCGGDLWGYGNDMDAVRQAAAPMLEAEREWPPPPLKRGKKT